MINLTLEEQATNFATTHHILTVGRFIHVVCTKLMERADKHDQSKLYPPEVELFAAWTPKLAACEYESEEYKKFRAALGPALEHHYAKNRHHTEHFPIVESGEIDKLKQDIKYLRTLDNIPDSCLEHLEKLVKSMEAPINNMNLIDVIELFVDWKSATLRHDTGNLRKSIEVNKERYSISDQLANIMENTVDVLGD